MNQNEMENLGLNEKPASKPEGPKPKTQLDSPPTNDKNEVQIGEEIRPGVWVVYRHTFVYANGTVLECVSDRSLKQALAVVTAPDATEEEKAHFDCFFKVRGWWTFHKHMIPCGHVDKGIILYFEVKALIYKIEKEKM